MKNVPTKKIYHDN